MVKTDDIIRHNLLQLSEAEVAPMASHLFTHRALERMVIAALEFASDPPDALWAVTVLRGGDEHGHGSTETHAVGHSSFFDVYPTRPHVRCFVLPFPLDLSTGEVLGIRLVNMNKSRCMASTRVQVRYVSGGTERRRNH